MSHIPSSFWVSFSCLFLGLLLIGMPGRAQSLTFTVNICFKDAIEWFPSNPAIRRLCSFSVHLEKYLLDLFTCSLQRHFKFKKIISWFFFCFFFHLYFWFSLSHLSPPTRAISRSHWLPVCSHPEVSAMPPINFLTSSPCHISPRCPLTQLS